MNWNGSDLGDIALTRITGQALYDGKIYIKIFYNDADNYAHIRYSKTIVPCIIDEIKSVFKLPKVGTHSATLDGRLCILYRVPHLIIDSIECFLVEPALSSINIYEIPDIESFKDLCRFTFAFRDIISLARTFESDIIIRCSPTGIPYPISYKETKFDFDAGEKLIRRSIIPNTIKTKWFNNESISITVGRMFNYNVGNDPTRIINNVRSKLETIFNRIDKNSSFCVSYICKRINEHLVYLSDKTIGDEY